MPVNLAARFPVLLALSLLLGLQGCATVYKPHNLPIQTVQNGQGYRYSKAHGGHVGDNLILVAFSGGGTRAAALAYGVLKALKESRIVAEGQQKSVLEDVDLISSVSGGSFTAAYYGLFGDRIFSDYEKVFLKKSIESTLISKLFDPSYWWRSLFTGFDRTEMAIEYYDNNIFEHKTFADIRLEQGPFIEINATDLGGGNRFAFIHTYFDTICSDLSAFSVARAVTASSAVPIAFPPVLMKNHTGVCDPRESAIIRYLENEKSQDPRIIELQQRLKSYLNPKKHPYIHLVDGGVSDNLGLRAVIERTDLIHSDITLTHSGQLPKNILIISVDAEVIPEHTLDESASRPSVAETFQSFSDAQFRLYNADTRLLLKNKLKDLEHHFAERGRPVGIYNIVVSFSAMTNGSLKSYLNTLPTSLELSETDVDLLTQTGADLLKGNADFRQFLAANQEPSSTSSGLAGDARHHWGRGGKGLSQTSQDLHSQGNHHALYRVEESEIPGHSQTK